MVSLIESRSGERYIKGALGGNHHREDARIGILWIETEQEFELVGVGIHVRVCIGVG